MEGGESDRSCASSACADTHLLRFEGQPGVANGTEQVDRQADEQSCPEADHEPLP